MLSLLNNFGTKPVGSYYCSSFIPKIGSLLFLFRFWLSINGGRACRGNASSPFLNFGTKLGGIWFSAFVFSSFVPRTSTFAWFTAQTITNEGQWKAPGSVRNSKVGSAPVPNLTVHLPGNSVPCKSPISREQGGTNELLNFRNTRRTNKSPGFGSKLLGRSYLIQSFL